MKSSNINKLEELLTWIYGKDDLPPKVKKQNPDLNYLREVIENPSSLDALRSGYSLKNAHEISIGDQRRFRESLIRAKEEIQRAKATVTTGYDGNDLSYQTLAEIIKTAKSLKEEMDKIRLDN